MKREELKKLFEDDAFAEKIKEVDSIEKLQSFLAEYKLNMTIEDINKAVKTGEELTDSELDDITGGGLVSWISFAWKCFTWGMIECE